VTVAGTRGTLSLRLRIALILAAINVALWSAFAFYVAAEGQAVRDDLERKQEKLKEATTDAVSSLLARMIRGQVAEKVAEGRAQPNARRLLGLELQKIPFWDEPEFRRYVEKAVVIRERPDGMPDVFHPRSDLIFDHGTFDPDSALRLIKRAAATREVARDGTRLAGQIRVAGEPWGGVYLSIVDPSRDVRPFDPFQSLRRVILIAALATLLLGGAIYLFLDRSVIKPLEALGRVATAAAGGDYSGRVPETSRGDEVGSVIEAQNRMMALIQDYSSNLENRVRESVDLIDRKNRELILAQRLASMGTLAAGIAHEINNPLGGMLNAALRLKRKDLSDEARDRYVALLEENIGRIGETVRRVLDLTPRRTTPGPVSLPDTIQRVIDLVGWRSSRKGVALHLQVHGTVRQVLGDPNEITQIFLNLAMNAIDATGSGGRLTFAISDDGAWVSTRVTDTGSGMPPDVLARAFDPFFTTKEAGSGTGLGLSIVHSLVTNLGGTVEVASEPGRGTTFTVRLRADGAARS
jgi:signal transduction histidine kinase